jgi:hypothetical protein
MRIAIMCLAVVGTHAKGEWVEPGAGAMLRWCWGSPNASNVVGPNSYAYSKQVMCTSAISLADLKIETRVRYKKF